MNSQVTWAWHSQGTAPYNGYLYAKEVSTEISKQIVVKCTIVNDGCPVQDMVFWYDCQYGQCDNGNNNTERAKQVLATLLTAQASDSKIDLNFYNTGSGLYFRAVKIVK